MAFKFNPLSGRFDLVTRQSLSAVGTIQKVMDCDSGVAVNDWVFQSASVNNTAVKFTDNEEVEPVLGIVISKPTTTSCTVLMLGLYSGSGLSGRGKMWLSDTGDAAFSFPTSGTGKFVRELGISFGDGTILVNPEKMGLELDNG